MLNSATRSHKKSTHVEPFSSIQWRKNVHCMMIKSNKIFSQTFKIAKKSKINMFAFRLKAEGVDRRDSRRHLHDL